MRELPHTTILRGRTAALKAQRERARAALDRTRPQCGTTATIDARNRRIIAPDERQVRQRRYRRPQGYVRSIIDAVDVDDHTVLGSSAAGIFSKSQANRLRTEMFAVLFEMARPKRFELLPPRFVVCCSRHQAAWRASEYSSYFERWNFADFPKQRLDGEFTIRIAVIDEGWM